MTVLDVVVIGGGPAGTATALRLARHGAETALYESSSYDRMRLGETLPPQINPLLRRLGVWDAFAELGSLPSHGISSVWGADEPAERSFLFDPHGNGWHVDRARFDRMLAEAAAEAGVRLFHERVRRVIDESSYFRVEAPTSVRAAKVVDATGRAAGIARRLGARSVRFDRLVCAARLFTTPHAPPGDTFIEAVEYGWWYVSPLPGFRRVVACFTDAHIAVRSKLGTPGGWSTALSGTRHSRRLAAGASPGPIRVVTTSGHRLHPCTGPGWLAVGDAALAVDPLSSNGVVFALRSAEAAAAALLDADSTEYADLVENATAQYLGTHPRIYGWEGRFAQADFWRARRRHDALPQRGRARRQP